jgi:hypothetical protein
MGDISPSPPSPTPNGRVNPLSIFLWTWGSILESLVTLSNKKITWVKLHPDKGHLGEISPRHPPPALS